MIQETNSLKRTARIAGLLYFILAILGIFSLMYVPPKINVKGDDINSGHVDPLFRDVDPPRLRGNNCKSFMMFKNTIGY